MTARTSIRHTVRILVGAALAGVLCDLPFRMISLLGLALVAGPKNMLPVLLGLLYGPVGAAGSALGVLLSAVAHLNLGWDYIAEMVAALLAGCVAWWLWYQLPVGRRPGCRNIRELTSLLLCVAAASVVAAVCMLPVPYEIFGLSAGTLALQVGLSTAVWSLLLGIPSLITASCMFGIVPSAPEGWAQHHQADDLPDLERTVINDPVSLGEMCDEVDLFNMTHGLAPQIGYAVMSCVEELSSLILEHLPEEGTVQVKLNVGDSVRLCLQYEGERYNPLAIPMWKKNEDDSMALLGIMIVREMAVHTKHEYDSGVNTIRIII